MILQALFLIKKYGDASLYLPIGFLFLNDIPLHGSDLWLAYKEYFWCGNQFFCQFPG